MMLAGSFRGICNQLILLNFFIILFAGCSSSNPETVMMEGTLALEVVPTPAAAVKFEEFPGCISNPAICEVQFKTQATANVQEEDDSFHLVFTNFDVTQTGGPDWGANIRLNPDRSSEGMIFKLDDAGNALDTHEFVFHIIAEIEGETFHFDGIRLRGTGHRMGLSSEFEPQAVSSGDAQDAMIRISSMTKDLGTDLI